MFRSNPLTREVELKEERVKNALLKTKLERTKQSMMQIIRMLDEDLQIGPPRPRRYEMDAEPPPHNQDMVEWPHEEELLRPAAMTIIPQRKRQASLPRPRSPPVDPRLQLQLRPSPLMHLKEGRFSPNMPAYERPSRTSSPTLPAYDELPLPTSPSQAHVDDDLL